MYGGLYFEAFLFSPPSAEQTDPGNSPKPKADSSLRRQPRRARAVRRNRDGLGRLGLRQRRRKPGQEAKIPLEGRRRRRGATQGLGETRLLPH